MKIYIRSLTHFSRKALNKLKMLIFKMLSFFHKNIFIRWVSYLYQDKLKQANKILADIFLMNLNDLSFCHKQKIFLFPLSLQPGVVNLNNSNLDYILEFGTKTQFLSRFDVKRNRQESTIEQEIFPIWNEKRRGETMKWSF